MYVIRKIFLSENGVDRSEAERYTFKIRTELKETVHTAGGTLHHQLHIVSQTLLLQLAHMFFGKRIERIDNHNDLLGVYSSKDAKQAVNQRFTTYVHKRLRECYSFLLQP